MTKIVKYPAKKTTKKTVKKPAVGGLSVLGTKIPLNDPELQLYTSLNDRKICKEDIYGQALGTLLKQFAVLNHVAGALELIKSVYPPLKQNKTKDRVVGSKEMDNLRHAIDLLEEVILEKFTPKPR